MLNTELFRLMAEQLFHQDPDVTVHATIKKKLRKLEFTEGHRTFSVVEQDINLKSKWAQQARAGKHVAHLYHYDRNSLAVYVDGEVTWFTKRR
jgi:hypothetical protein